ncbi:YtxH domain-containing protein [Mucilaginibacter sp.]|uniref:YtxH domain-containing protein n=1 Tax=Mucilaginibacter sp. TaxID=1882438 RepID=UPI003B00AFF2
MSIKKDLLKKTKEYAEQAREYAKDHAKDYADQAKSYAKDHAKDYAGYAKSFAKDKAKDYSSEAKKYAQDKVGGGHAAAVAVALIGGIVIGAALGILFAPEAGTETRSNLGTSLQEFGNTVADKAQQGKEAITNLKDKAVDAVKNKMGEGAEGEDADIDHPSFS